RCARRQDLLEQHVRARARPGLNLHLIHQAMDTYDPDTHAGLGAVFAIEYLLEIRYSRARVAHTHQQYLRGALALEPEFDFAATRIAVGIARDLGDGSCDSCLILGIETDQRRDLACALSCDHHILLVVQGYGQKGFGCHVPIPLFMTTTVTSSRPRSWSRYSTPAMR